MTKKFMQAIKNIYALSRHSLPIDDRIHTIRLEMIKASANTVKAAKTNKAELIRANETVNQNVYHKVGKALGTIE